MHIQNLFYLYIFIEYTLKCSLISFFQYLTKGGPEMMLDLYKKILGKKSSSSSEPLQMESTEEEEDDGNVFTLTQKASEDSSTTYTECTQVSISLM